MGAQGREVNRQEIEFEVGILSSLVVGMDHGDDDVLNAISNILERLIERPVFADPVQGAVRDTLSAINRLLAEDANFGETYDILSKTIDLIYDDLSNGGDETQRPSNTLAIDLDNPELSDFISETEEYLEASEAALLVLESDPNSKESIDEIFRCFHNIKGIAGFLSLTDFQNLAHAAESVMDNVRSGEKELSGNLAQVIFDVIDMKRSMLSSVHDAMEGEEYRSPPSLSRLIRSLESMDFDDVGHKVGPFEPRRQDKDPAKKVEDMLRVSTSKLDSLIDSVGELVIANGMVQQDADEQDGINPRFIGNIQRLGKIIRELQEQTMSLRMVTLESTFRKLTRVARDISVNSGISLQFTFSGENTELDRSVVEDIQSPLVHMVRNAIDHGIESPEERSHNGKPDKGEVHISAFHRGGNVVIEIRDDGRGLDKEAILKKATTAGLIPKDADLGEKEIYDLIFAPGFSTNKQVTEVSGRGVGMDVVKKALEKLRGRLEIASETGKGTTFSIYLPLTTAVIDGMVVTVGNHHMIVPSIAIQESLRPQKEQLLTIKEKGELILIRGNTLPLFRLNRLFNIPCHKEDPTKALVLVIADGDKAWALVVDDLLGQQQVVVKPMDPMFKNIWAISGASIMGDGSVALILDVAGLLRMARGAKSA